MVIGAGAQDEAGAALADPEGPAAVPPADGARELAQLPLPHLRARRDALRAEVERVVRWQRLVRARLDLAVAAALGVDDLLVPLEAATDGGPLDVHAGRDLAEHGLVDPAVELRELVLPAALPVAGPRPGALIVLVQRLGRAQRRLGGYREALDAELAQVDATLAGRCGAPQKG